MIGYNPSSDPRNGRNHILTKNPEIAKCGKRVAGGFQPEKDDAPMCGRCDPNWHPKDEVRIKIPHGGWSKDGSYYRDTGTGKRLG